MAATVNRPNVLLICCDHLRADNLGCNGHPAILTPQIDKLAAAGLNCRGAMSESPVCVPARRILMTGMSSYGVNMHDYHDTQTFPEGPKLAEVMTRAGYQTFASGKLHVYPQRDRIGFEDVQLHEEGRRLSGLKADDYEAWLSDHGYGHLAYTHGLGNNQYGVRVSPVPEKFTSTHWTAEKAMEFLERRDPTRPFFLYASFDKPHPPITPPAEYWDMYRDVPMPAPVYGAWADKKLPSQMRALRDCNNWDAIRNHPLGFQPSLRGFAAMITHIDSMIGCLLGQVREQGELDNTWVLLTSDHGDMLFDHGGFAKSNFFRGSSNVPFIVCPPKSWRQAHARPAGRVDESTPVGLMDIMPTILDAAGIEMPKNVEGQSVVPLLKNEGAPFRPYSCGRCGPAFAVTDGRTMYHWFADDGIELLFDRRNDPREMHDLSEDPASRGRLEECRARLVEWMSRHGDPLVAGGKLPRMEKNWHFEVGASRNNWNNRGRH